MLKEIWETYLHDKPILRLSDILVLALNYYLFSNDWNVFAVLGVDFLFYFVYIFVRVGILVVSELNGE